MMRKGMCTAALCALLMGGAAVAAEDAIDSGTLDGAPAVATEPATGAAPDPAGGAFARMPPGAEPEAVPAPPPLAEDGAVAVPEGNGTNVEAPAEDRAADEAPAATGEDAGSRI